MSDKSNETNVNEMVHENKSKVDVNETNVNKTVYENVDVNESVVDVNEVAVNVNEVAVAVEVAVEETTPTFDLKRITSICDNMFELKTIGVQQSDELNDTYDQFRHKFDSFIFEGGGIRGIGFGGSIKYLEEHNLLKQINRFAGSSAGAIVAAALAVGYSGDDIIKILHDTNFEEFKDDSFGVILDIWRFINEYGVYKGEKFLDWIGDILKAKTGNANITFKEVYDKYGKELVVTGTNVNQYKTRYFHHKKDPHMPVKLAVRISMSIPVFFKAVKLTEYECVNCHEMMPDNDSACYECGHEHFYKCVCGEKITSGYGMCDTCKNPNKLQCKHCNEAIVKEVDKRSRVDKPCWNCAKECAPRQIINYYVDGGVLNNYPIWVFDGKYIGDPHITEEDINKSNSLGFKLMTDQESKDYQLYHAEIQIKGIVDFLTCLINSMSIQIERGHIRHGYWDKTVTISTHNVNWLEFNLPAETKEKLIQQGYDAIHDKIVEINKNKTP